MCEPDLIFEIKNYVERAGLQDFSVFSYGRGQLIICGSSDRSYYHSLEIIAEDPIYMQGEIDWYCDVSSDFIKANVGLPAGDVRKLDFYSDDGLAFSVTAEKFKLNFDRVFYYRRDNLQPGERIADWVK